MMEAITAGKNLGTDQPVISDSINLNDRGSFLYFEKIIARRGCNPSPCNSDKISGDLLALG